jgi:3-oxoacyl-[acyl-carrier protein] reductase
VQDVIRDFGRLDVLVDNAAVAPVKPIDELTIADWDEVLNVNLRAAFFCAQQAFIHMRESGRGGRLIFMTSQAGQAGGVFVGAHYVASKAALMGVMKSFAKAGAAYGILANCVAPGQIDTPLTSEFPADKVEQLTRQIPLGRMGGAGEVASVVRFLASSESSYVTGATIGVNGGLLMP